jgi:hypothetical protein
MMSVTPEAGQIIGVRQRRYVVDEVVAPQAGDDATLVLLSCVDDDAQEQPLEVLWEEEVDPETLSPLKRGGISPRADSTRRGPSRPICTPCDGTA